MGSRYGEESEPCGCTRVGPHAPDGSTRHTSERWHAGGNTTPSGITADAPSWAREVLGEAGRGAEPRRRSRTTEKNRSYRREDSLVPANRKLLFPRTRSFLYSMLWSDP